MSEIVKWLNSPVEFGSFRSSRSVKEQMEFLNREAEEACKAWQQAKLNAGKFANELEEYAENNYADAISVDRESGKITVYPSSFQV